MELKKKHRMFTTSMTQTTAGIAGHQQTQNTNLISQETLGSKSCDRTNPYTEARQVVSDKTEDRYEQALNSRSDWKTR